MKPDHPSSPGISTEIAIKIFALATISLAVTACATAGDIEEVEPSFELPENWHQERVHGETLEEDWCANFGDPGLEGIIEEVLVENLDLRIAQARLDESRALLSQSRSRRHPQVSIGAEAEFERGPDGFSQDYEIPLRATYELDLWGRLRSEISADQRDYLAEEADLTALRILLAAQTAEQYYELARTRATIDLIEEQMEIANTFLELTKVRRAQGMASAIDVIQQQQRIDQLRELHRAAQLDKTLAYNGMASLLGRPPGEVEVVAARRLPETLPPVADFLPADLLERRPDIWAARTRVIAADHRVDAALAERLPQLQISATLSAQSNNLRELFDYLFVTGVGSLLQPIWDGGRRSARVAEEEAQREQSLLEFSATLLDAIREVEDTLARGQALYEILLMQRVQLDLAQDALELAKVQYRAGVLDYLRVLTAMESVQALESAELDSRRALLSQRIHLCRVAGGFWPSDGDESEEDR